MARALLLTTDMGIKKASNFRREGRNPKLTLDADAPSEFIPTKPSPADERPTKPAPRQTPGQRRVATDFALRDTDPRLPPPDMVRRPRTN